jgi:hypothetical protein
MNKKKKKNFQPIPPQHGKWALGDFKGQQFLPVLAVAVC